MLSLIEKMNTLVANNLEQAKSRDDFQHLYDKMPDFLRETNQKFHRSMYVVVYFDLLISNSMVGNTLFDSLIYLLFFARLSWLFISSLDSWKWSAA